MQSLVDTKDRFKSLLTSPSSLLQLNSILESTLSTDRLFLLKTFLLYFSDHLDPKFQNYLGSTLKYLFKMSWPTIGLFQRKFLANFLLLVLQTDRLVEFDLTVSIFEDLSAHLDRYSANDHSDPQSLFGPQLPLITRLAEVLRSRASQAPLLANPNTLHDVSLMLRTILDLQQENESLAILKSIFENFASRPMDQWGHLLQILLILFEKGDDRMHVTFQLSLSSLLAIHSREGASGEIRLKCLQLVYLVIRTMNWTDICLAPGTEAETSQLQRLLSQWVDILKGHLHGQSQAHTLFVFKIVDEVFKDQERMTEQMAPVILADLVASFLENLKWYLQAEVFGSFQEDSDPRKDVETLCEYTLDEDQHYANITQAIIIKFVDIVQNITFTCDATLTEFLSKGSQFLVNVFFLLVLMNQEDIFLWREEPNQYIQDDDDETNLYAIKPAVLGCLNSLIEKYPALYTQAIVDIADVHAQQFISIVRAAGVSNLPLLFDSQSQIFSENALETNSVFKQLLVLNQPPQSGVFQQIWNFISKFLPTRKSNCHFLLCAKSLVKTLSTRRQFSDLFVDLWKKMEATFLMVVTFVKDIVVLDPGNQAKLGHYGQVCVELLNLPMTDVLTGRAIWAVSSLKHFSSTEAEFFEIYSLVCRFLAPSTTLCVRLCASRTITRMSFRIASENKQALVAQKIGESMRDLHSWVFQLMQEADEKTFHLIIDNLVSFYDICPQLLAQELSTEHCQFLLEIFRRNYQNSILASCFVHLFKKIASSSVGLTKLWPPFMAALQAFVNDTLASQLRREIEFEHKMDSLLTLLDLLGLLGNSDSNFQSNRSPHPCRPVHWCLC